MSSYETSLISGGRWLAVAALLSAGYLAGVSSHDTTVQADVRRSSTEPQHFLSGAQRSEILLQQIVTTLGTMDGRLDRIEKAAQQLATRSGPATVEGKR